MLEEVKLCPNHFQWKGTVYLFFVWGGGMFLYVLVWLAGIEKDTQQKEAPHVF